MWKEYYGLLKIAGKKITYEIPDCNLIICGNVCDELKGFGADNIILKGRISDEKLRMEIKNSTISINPIKEGT